MKSKRVSKKIFENYNPANDTVKEDYKRKECRQKLAVNRKGLHELETEIASRMAEEFTSCLFTDPEFPLIFSINPRLKSRAGGIIKTLFIQNANKIFDEGDPAVLKQIISDCLNSGIFNKYNRLAEENETLKKQARFDSPSFIELEKARRENRELRQENLELNKKLEEKEELLTLASANLKLNSSNSNLPPSMDLYPPKPVLAEPEESEDREPAPEKEASRKDSAGKNSKKRKTVPNTREKTERKKGAQPGHQGKTLSLKRIRELLEAGVKKEIISLGEIEGNNFKSGYLLDLDIVPVIKEIRVPLNEPLPKELQGGPAYGLKIRELIVLLSTEGLMGYDRLAGVLNELSGNVLGISSGAVYGYAEEFSRLSLPAYWEIANSLKEAPVLATDATTFKVNGKKHYVRNHSTPELVWYYPAFTKKVEELLENPLLSSFHNILLHDHETGLYNLDCTHAECNIHSFRPMILLKELTPHQWPDKMMDLFREYNKKRNLLKAQGKTCFSQGELKRFDKEFNKIIRLGRRENKQEKREKIKKKECRLLNKIENYKLANTLFLYNFDVDFTDNISERDLRTVVRKRKMIGTFRSFQGLENYCVTLSLTESSKKKGIPILSTIQKIYTESSTFWTNLL